MPSGTVKWFNPTKRFGFIEREEGENDVFVHMTAVEEASLSSLMEGQKVNFEVATDDQGKTSAVGLSLIEDQE